MKLGVETFGNWSAIANAERDLFSESQFKALKGEGEAVKIAGRNVIKAAKLRGASKLAGALRGTIFPKNAKVHPQRPAYVLGTSAQKLFELFDTGATIRARSHALLVPIGEAAKVKHPAFAEPSGRASRAYQAMTAKYGKLVQHRLKDGALALGAFVTAGRGKQKFLPLFLLLKQVVIPKKTNVLAEIARASQGLEQRVGERAITEFEQGHDAVVAKIMGPWAR